MSISSKQQSLPDVGPKQTSREELERRIRVLRERLERVTSERDRLRLRLDAKAATGRSQKTTPPPNAIDERARETAAAEASARKLEALRSQREMLRSERDALRTQLLRVRLQRDAAKSKLEQQSSVQSPAEQLTHLIATGEGPAAACVRYVRGQIADRARVDARSFAHALMDDPMLAEVGRLCSAIYAHADGFRPLTLHLLSQVRSEWVSQFAQAEYLDAMLSERPEEGRRVAKIWLDGGPTDDAAVFTAMGRLVARKELGLAERACDLLLSREEALSEHVLKRTRWTKEQLVLRREASAISPLVTDEPAKVRFGIIDYKMLDYDKASSNIGDHVQTLAALSNVVRFQNIRLSSNVPGLAGWVDGLRARLRNEYRLEGPGADVELTLVDRDLSSSRRYAAPTWMIAFGWYMHPNFKDFFDFPFVEGLRPFFISFHVNNRAMLTPEAVDYLRRHGPVGCRDWTTVYLLREHGIEAFFSGCMTTTVGKLFPKVQAGSRDSKKVALVDYKPQESEFSGMEVSAFAHAGSDVRHRTFIENMDDAIHLLSTYQEYDHVATSRLHCYLPCTALGLDVTFKPRSMSDIRFEGLVELGDNGFEKIRDGIESKLQKVLECIFSGHPEEVVRQVWRDACAEDVAHAEKYCRTDIDLPRSEYEPAELAFRLRESAVHGGLDPHACEVKVAFAVDANLAEQLPVVLESALVNSRGALHIHVMTRGLGIDYWNRLIREFGHGAALSLFNFDLVDYGNSLRMLAHTTVSTMDRLLLPELLPDLGKIIYLDVDILVLGDLRELWSTELGTAPIAGKSSTFSSWRYGYNMAYRAAGSLDHRKAWRLRRSLHAAGPLVFSAFNAGVVVMNLERMRRDGFATQYLPLIENYGMNDQDALNLYARTERIPLGVEWNAVPSQDITDNAKIIHFAGPVKPWSEYVVTRGKEFQAYRKIYLDRVQLP